MVLLLSFNWYNGIKWLLNIVTEKKGEKNENQRFFGITFNSNIISF